MAQACSHTSKHTNYSPAFVVPGRSFAVLNGVVVDPLTQRGGVACVPGKAWGILEDSTSSAGLPTAGEVVHGTKSTTIQQ